MALRELEEDAVETLILVVAAGVVIYFGGQYIGRKIADAFNWLGDNLPKIPEAIGAAATAASSAAQQPGSGDGAPYSEGDPYVY